MLVSGHCNDVLLTPVGRHRRERSLLCCALALQASGRPGQRRCRVFVVVSAGRLIYHCIHSFTHVQDSPALPAVRLLGVGGWGGGGDTEEGGIQGREVQRGWRVLDSPVLSLILLSPTD